MCRFAAYLGPPRALSTLLYDPPRSLEALAYDPREMQSGNVNVDGTGVAWWPDLEVEPLRYVTDATPWADPNLPSLSRRLRGRAHVAAVRSATPGLPFGPGAVAPFVHGTTAFAHNGWLGGFRTGVGRDLMRSLPDPQHALIATVTDSVVLHAHFLAAREAGADLVEATRQTVLAGAKACADAGAEATLNLLVSDGRSVVAARASQGRAGNSLYHLRDQGDWTRAAVIASEPLDPSLAWAPVPDRHLVVIGPDDTDVTPLDL